MIVQLLLPLLLVLGGCASAPRSQAREVPGTLAVAFMPGLIPDGMLIHGGCFSPDLSEFMFTISDMAFQHFDVKTIRRIGNQEWSSPEDAFFNSSDNEHGTSYSPDGMFLYFSSTRPVQNAGVASTWHIWRCQKKGDRWGAPTYVDIPNMRDKLTSHASLATDGTLYFHGGEPDYSELHIYSAKPEAAQFGAATKLPAGINQGVQQYTPFIDPAQRFLVYGGRSGLMLSLRDKKGAWSQAAPLGERIPTQSRGNPYITPDGRYLLFAAGDDPTPATGASWAIYWVKTAGLIGSSTGVSRLPSWSGKASAKP